MIIYGWLYVTYMGDCLVKLMNVIVYTMWLLDSPRMSLRVTPILRKCMIMGTDLHMLIIMFIPSIQEYGMLKYT